MKILFTTDCNGHEIENPYATLIDVENTTIEEMKALEKTQKAAERIGGSYLKILEDGNITHKELKSGKFSDFATSEYDYEYRLISGNY